MARYLILVTMAFALCGCQPHDLNYYRLHPEQLKQAINHCPERSPSMVSCAQLEEAAVDVNRLVYLLQSNPQQFGQKILHLQETLASQQAALKTEPQAASLQKQVIQSQQQLAEHLAIINWLESPES